MYVELEDRVVVYVEAYCRSHFSSMTFVKHTSVSKQAAFSV